MWYCGQEGVAVVSKELIPLYVFASQAPARARRTISGSEFEATAWQPGSENILEGFLTRAGWTFMQKHRIVSAWQYHSFHPVRNRVGISHYNGCPFDELSFRIKIVEIPFVIHLHRI